jgi:hypothetical protein
VELVLKRRRPPIKSKKYPNFSTLLNFLSLKFPNLYISPKEERRLLCHFSIIINRGVTYAKQ